MSTAFSQAQFEALKARAKRIRRERLELTQVQALDIVAREYGFQSWALLARAYNRSGTTLEAPLAAIKPHIVKIRAIVRSRDRSVRNMWWDEEVPANHSEAYYERFDWVPEHLQIADFEERVVRSRIAKTRRIIEFMDASELKPSKAWVRLWGYHPAGRPRGMDHSAVWRDKDNRFVVTTEPYGGERTIEDLRTWCVEKGWKFAVGKQGQGMWHPCPTSCEPGCGGHSRLIFMAPPKNGGDPEAIAARL